MLLHEPEVVAMASIKHQMHPVPFAEGNTFIVVDAGGGTVDTTTMRYMSNTVTQTNAMSQYQNCRFA